MIEGKDKIGDDRWYLAEDSDAILRSMKEPTVYGQPDHYSALSNPIWSSSLDSYFQGSTNTIMTYDEIHPASFSVPSSGIGNIWTVCKISVDDSGNVIISPINTLSNHSTPSTIGS